MRKILPLADDAVFRQDFRQAKRLAKARFADWLKAACGLSIDPDTIFDCQIKRIHEYKRQLLNVLHIIVLYDRLRANPKLDLPPRTFLFGGKAAHAYGLAKLISSSSIASAPWWMRTLRAAGRLNVLFLPDYNVSLAERVIPASDVSEQISTAGYEASRHQQHEVHDERGVDGRHTRWRAHRDSRGSRPGEPVPVRPERAAGWRTAAAGIAPGGTIPTRPRHVRR